MDLRRPIILLSLFAATAVAQDVIVEPTQTVEATRLDVFSERTTGWKFETLKAEDTATEVNQGFESISRLPGVTASAESPRISIRGSASLDRMLGLYDGVPLNMSDGFGPERLLLPNENVDSLRIIKGPASLFWGRNAMGGAINFLPRFYESPTLRGHVGSFGQRGIFAATPIYGDEAHSFAQWSSFAESIDGNFSYYLPSTGNTATRSQNDRHLLRHTLRAQQKLSRLTISESVLYATETGTLPDRANIPNPAPIQFAKRAGLAVLSASWSMSETETLFFRTHGISVENKTFHETASTDSKRWANTISYKKTLYSGSVVEAFTDQSSDQFTASYVGGKTYQTNEFESGVIFDIPFNQNWVIKPGVRYLWNYKALVPAVGFFEENAGLTRWLTYSHGFRTPSLTAKYTDDPSFKGNPDLKPETSEQTELGFLQVVTPNPNEYWRKYRYGLAAFLVMYKDFIEANASVTPNTISNQGHASAQGFDAQAGIDSDNWGADITFTYQKTEDQSRRPLSLSPEIQTILSLHHGWGPIIFEVRDTYWTKYFESGYEHSGWNTIDLTARSTAFQKWSFKAGIYNILDQPRELVRGFPEPQRRLWAMLERSF